VTWKLRHGVRWHDGVPFSSQDVKATYDFFWLRYRDHNPTALVSTSGWDQVVAVETPDPYTAVVHFGSIFAPYLTLGSGPYGILPAHLLQQVWQGSGDLTRGKVTVSIPGGFTGTATLDHVMVGTGPFMFKEWVPGSHLTLVRNPHWWGAHQPYLDAIQVKFETDPNSELNDLQNHVVDLALDLRASLLPALFNRVPDANTVVIPASATEHLDLNLHNPFLQDAAVRRAILMGIDRQKIVDTLLVGKSVVPADAWMCIGSGAWCLDPQGPRTTYDVDGANSLLDQAGYKLQTDGPCKGYRADSQGRCLQLHIASTSLPLREEEEVVIAADLARIGVQVIRPFDNVPAGRLFGSCVSGGLIYSHSFDLALYTSSYSYPAEPDSLAFPAYHSSQIPTDSDNCEGQNTTYVSDTHLDAALEDARQTVDLASRRSDYIQAQEILDQLLPEIPLYQGVQVEASLKRLQGYKGNEFWWMNNSADWFVNTTR
jgi:peptide/nickel transport system substrate-binding protein